MTGQRCKEKKTMRLSLAALAAAVAALATTAPAHAAGEADPLRAFGQPSDGIFGTFDRNQLQRGLKVYLGVCAGCHGLRHVSYRNLVEIGLTPSEAKEVAAQKQVTEIGDDGQPRQRPADLADRFVSPFPTDQAAAAANGGKAPPDLSLITKARAEGPAYLYSLLTGYLPTPPADKTDSEGKPLKLDPGQYYNKHFPGHVIAMAPPISADNPVDYGDGSKPTVDQMAADVTAFLTWTAEPKMEERKRTGIKVILFLLVFTGIFYVVKRRVWRDVH